MDCFSKDLFWCRVEELGIFFITGMLTSFGYPSSPTAKKGADAASDKRALQRRIQGDMVIYQSDARKLEREIQVLQMQVREAVKKLKLLELDLKTKQDFLKKKEAGLFEVNEQLRQLKKKLNTVG
jgi:hypothetical protein